jgi:hypothetical protein
VFFQRQRRQAFRGRALANGGRRRRGGPRNQACAVSAIEARTHGQLKRHARVHSCVNGALIIQGGAKLWALQSPREQRAYITSKKGARLEGRLTLSRPELTASYSVMPASAVVNGALIIQGGAKLWALQSPREQRAYIASNYDTTIE